MSYYVYFLTNKLNNVLYIGITNNLIRRVYEHREKLSEKECFTKRYLVNKLVHYEIFLDVTNAIQREKNLKKWSRQWKNELIQKHNPDWKDLWNEIVS